MKVCVTIVYQTQSLLGNPLKIYTVNTSSVECVQVDGDEYTIIAVFALLQNGLERLPLVTAFFNMSNTPLTTG